MTRFSYFQNDKSLERKIYWMSFATRCLFGLAACWMTTHLQISLFDDAMFYYKLGTTIAQEWLSLGTSHTFHALIIEGKHHAWAMILLIALFSILGNGLESMPILMFLYALITSWAPVITYKIARSLGLIPRSAFFASLFVVFSPCFAFWGGALYKEGLVFLALNLLVYHVLLLQRRFRMVSIIVLSLSIFFLLVLRFYLPVLLI